MIQKDSHTQVLKLYPRQFGGPSRQRDRWMLSEGAWSREMKLTLVNRVVVRTSDSSIFRLSKEN